MPVELVLQWFNKQGFYLCFNMQASEKHVHFTVSRQTRQRTPDILQEAGWDYSGSHLPCPSQRNNPNKVRPITYFPSLGLLLWWERKRRSAPFFH